MRKKIFLIIALGIGLFFQILNAQTWSPAKRLTYSSGTSFQPAIATDSSNNIHVVWDDDSPGNREIFYKRSTDGGATWSAAKRLTYSLGFSMVPAIATDSSNNLHVAWMDDSPGNWEIFYKRSTDGGTTWSPAKRLTYSSGSSYYPDIAIDLSNNINVVWQDDSPGNWEIFYKRSTDGGTTWSAAKRLTYSSGYSGLPDIATDTSNNLHVVWYDYSPGNWEIFYKRSTDGGTTWSAAKRLTYSSGYSSGPDIATDTSNNLHVVWYDYSPGNYEIFYKRSTDGGATWSAAKRLTYSLGFSMVPAIATDSSNNFHVVWDDDSPGNWEIFYKRSTDGGTTWSAARRLTYDSGSSSYPAIATDSSNNIHVIWDDLTPGNYEIFYKKGTQ